MFMFQIRHKETGAEGTVLTAPQAIEDALYVVVLWTEDSSLGTVWVDDLVLIMNDEEEEEEKKEKKPNLLSFPGGKDETTH